MDDRPTDTKPDKLGHLCGQVVTVALAVTAVVAMVCLCMLMLYWTIGWTSC
jgi:hypothetical protein